MAIKIQSQKMIDFSNVKSDTERSKHVESVSPEIPLPNPLKVETLDGKKDILNILSLG